MEAVGGILAFTGFLAFFAGVVSLIRPLRFLRITTRKKAAAIVGLAFVTFMIGGSLLPTPDNAEALIATGAEETAGDLPGSDAGTATSAGATTTSTTRSATTTLTQGTTTTTRAVTTTTAAVTTTTAELPAANIEASVREVLNDQYRGVEITDQVGGGVGVAIEMEVSDNLSMSWIAGGFKLDAGDVIVELFTGVQASHIRWTSVEGFFPLTDQYGNTTPGRIIQIRFDGSEAARVNWDFDESTLKLDILPGLYEWLFIHPELAEHLP